MASQAACLLRQSQCQRDCGCRRRGLVTERPASSRGGEGGTAVTTHLSLCVTCCLVGGGDGLSELMSQAGCSQFHIKKLLRSVTH